MSLIRKEKDSMVLLLKIFLVSVVLIRVGHDLNETIDFFIHLKFMYSEKATKFCKISTLLLTGAT